MLVVALRHGGGRSTFVTPLPLLLDFLNRQSLWFGYLGRLESNDEKRARGLALPG